MEIELLSNLDLDYYCKLFKINIIQVLSKDLFKNYKAKAGCYIVNLGDSNTGGTHWTSFIINDKIATYFDSFGLIPPQSIVKFIKRYNKHLRIIYSIDQIQDYNSVLCGWFCVYYLYFFNVLHKKNTSNISYLLNNHNQKYDLDNTSKNDGILQLLIKGILKNKIISI